MTDAQALGGLAAVGAFLGLFVIIGIVLYVLFAFGLYTMANRRQIDNPWMAFIPIAQIYTLGEVIGPVKIMDYEVDKPGLYLLAAVVGCWVLSTIPVLGAVFSLASIVVSIGSMYFLFSRYTTENTPIIYTIISVVLPFMGPIFVFMIRNNEYLAPDISSAA